MKRRLNSLMFRLKKDRKLSEQYNDVFQEQLSLGIIERVQQYESSIFLLTGLRIYTGEYKARGPTLCPTEGRALRGRRPLCSPV